MGGMDLAHHWLPNVLGLGMGPKRMPQGLTEFGLTTSPASAILRQAMPPSQFYKKQ